MKEKIEGKRVKMSIDVPIEMYRALNLMRLAQGQTVSSIITNALGKDKDIMNSISYLNSNYQHMLDLYANE